MTRAELRAAISRAGAYPAIASSDDLGDILLSAEISDHSLAVGDDSVSRYP